MFLLGAEEVINPVAPDVANMFWGAVFFLLLLVVMYTTCLPPVVKAMKQRQEQQRLDAEAADKADTDAEQVRRDFESTLAGARTEASRLIDAARTEAESERQSRLAEVTAELDAARQESLASFATERASALSGASGELKVVAAAAASKVVGRPVDAASQGSIIDDAVASATTR